MIAITHTCINTRKIKRTGDEHDLRVAVLPHVVVGLVGNRVNVRREIAQRLLVVRVNLAVAEAVELLVRVDGREDRANVRVDLVACVALVDVVQNGTLVQVAQLGHVRRAVDRRLVHVRHRRRAHLVRCHDVHLQRAR